MHAAFLGKLFLFSLNKEYFFPFDIYSFKNSLGQIHILEPFLLGVGDLFLRCYS